MKLLPKYSVRAALAWLALCGAAFFVLSLGYRGLRYDTVATPYGERSTLVPQHDWAVWLSALMVVLLVVVGTHAAFFVLLGAVELLARALHGPRPEQQTPFRPERPARLPVSDVPLAAGAKEPLRLLSDDVPETQRPAPPWPTAAPPALRPDGPGRSAAPPPPPPSARRPQTAEADPTGAQQPDHSPAEREPPPPAPR
jgi:hypothetical protein